MFDGGYEADIDTVRQNVREAEVVTFYFPLLQKTLLIDTRTLAGQGVEGSMPVPVADAARHPLVRIVSMARSADERFASLRRLRPEFERPESITMIPWARRVDSLLSEGVWALLLERLEAADRIDDADGPAADLAPAGASTPGEAGSREGGEAGPGTGEPQAAACAPPVLMAARLFDRLREMEARAMRDALTGVGHRTLWGVAGAGDEG